MMRRHCTLLLALALASAGANAEIPYKMRDGLEEVDYEKLNSIKEFKLPDSGDRKSTRLNSSH